VGEICLPLDSKEKLKLPCFFLEVAPFLQIIFALWLIDKFKAIIIHLKIYKNEKKGSKEGLIC